MPAKITNIDFSGFVRQYSALAVVSLIWFMMQLLRYVFPPLFETFQTSYGVSNTEAGALFTALMIGYALIQFPAGWFVDRLDATIVLSASAFVYAGASLFIFATQNYWLLSAAAVLIGIGTGPHKTAAIPYQTSTPTEPGPRSGLWTQSDSSAGCSLPFSLYRFSRVRSRGVTYS